MNKKNIAGAAVVSFLSVLAVGSSAVVEKADAHVLCPLPNLWGGVEELCPFHPHSEDLPKLDVIPDPNPPLPPTRGELYNHFTVNNQTGNTLYVATARYVGLHFEGGFGSDVQHTLAYGWFEVKPYSSSLIYEGNTDDGTIWVRIESSDGAVRFPANYVSTRDLCTSNQRFRSRQNQEDITDMNQGNDNIKLSVGDQNQLQGSCSAVGGHYDTFWQLESVNTVLNITN
jgi:hypothetical protein